MLSETDQIAAHVRDLTQGQLVCLADSFLRQSAELARALTITGHPAGPDLGVSIALAGLAIDRLADTHPRECVADTLTTITDLLNNVSGANK